MAKLGYEETVQLIRIHQTEGLGDKTLVELFEDIGDPQIILKKIQDRKLNRGRNIGKPLPREEAEKLAQGAERKNIWLLPFYHPEYPQKLKNIHHPPPILYVCGSVDKLKGINLAVVGTRRYTKYGKRAVNKIVPRLVNHGIGIISGMALGIDSFAHRDCLDSNGYTVAVLGSGVDVIVPRQNQAIYGQICSRGAVVSEFRLRSQARRGTFPRRNRIIAGLSNGVLVVEAGKRSGALITVEHGLEQGKEIFAVPGSIFSHASVGTNNLVKLGAKAVTKAEDILEELEYEFTVQKIEETVNFENQIQEKIYKQVKQGRTEMNELVETLDRPASELLSAVTELELKGVLRRDGRGRLELQ